MFSRIISRIIYLLTYLIPIGKSISKLIRLIEQAVLESEQLFKDGKIDVSERKILATKIVEIAFKELNIKVNWLLKLAISWIIDEISQRLSPRNIDVPLIVTEALKDVKNGT